MPLVKKILFILAVSGFIIYAFYQRQLVLGAQPIFTAFQGGTGTTSPSGILYGDSTIRLKTVSIGSGLTFSGGTLSSTGGAGNPGGSDTQVQFNDGGSFGGDGGFLWIKSTDTLQLGLVNSSANITTPTGTGSDSGGELYVTTGNGGASGGSGGGFYFTSGTGLAGSGQGGDFQIILGNGSTSGTGGDLDFYAGHGGLTAAGGHMRFTAGNGGATSGAGGDVRFEGGTGFGSGAGGPVYFLAGSSNGSGAGGSFTLASGSSGSNSGGDVIITTGSAGGDSAGGGLSVSLGAGSGAGAGGGISMGAGTGGDTGNGGGITISAGGGGATSGHGGGFIFNTGSASGGDSNGGNIILNLGIGAGTGQNGRIGIGTTTPGSILTIVGDASIQAGTSTSQAKVGGTLNVNTTQVGNVGGGEDNLITYSVSSSTLVTNGDYLEITAFGTFNNGNFNNKTLKLYFGNTLVAQTYGNAWTGSSGWEMHSTIIRTGAATQIGTAGWMIGNDTPGFIDAHATTTSPTETLSSPVTIKVTGTGTNNDDIVQKALIVKYYSAP